MKKINSGILFGIIILILASCSSSKISFEEIQKKVYSNNFNFIAKNLENNSSFSVPVGTGRINQTNLPTQPDGSIGIQVTHDRLVINLPSNDQEMTVNKYSLNTISQDFTVARKDLENGNILINFFLNDKKDINLIKMEIDKSGKIDCSVEGPTQKPLLYTGYLEK
ncbi:hypothetical protein [Kaistella sp.]|uniref:hypothetical protein n=1 Tax=Kaistella sp. TaxID=2782235 RepID=UPI002F95BC5E